MNETSKKVAFKDLAEVSARENGKVVVVGLKSENLLDEAQIETIKNGVSELVKSEKAGGVKERTFVIDMSGVEHMNAQLLAALLEINTQLKIHGDNDLRVAGASASFLEVLTITRLDQTFHLAENVEAAVAAANKPRGLAR